MITIQQDARPPFIQFETRAIEDRQSSEQAGHYVAKDVDYVIITPIGSMNTVEREASEWINEKKKQAAIGKYDGRWVDAFEQKYLAFKKGQDAPLNGTPIKDWPTLSPADKKNLIALNILTVEDLANLTEEALGKVGMGSRLMKQKAQAWLDSAKNIGAAAEKIVSLEVQNNDLQTTVQSLAEKVRELEVALRSVEKRKKE